jgi:hypothetical protein
MIHDNELHAGLTHALFCLSKWQQHRDSHKERHQFQPPNQIANTTQSLYFIDRLRSTKLMTCKQQFSSQAMSFTKILTSKSLTKPFIEPFKILNTISYKWKKVVIVSKGMGSSLADVCAFVSLFRMCAPMQPADQPSISV